MSEILFFIFGVIGLTHIVVDSQLMAPVRDWLKKILPPKIFTIFQCYQCSGFWCGLICGWFILTHSIPLVILAGCAGSFLAQMGALYLNYLEAKSIVDGK